jgi:TolB-like protein/DNA-binding winged helix-turn-helix (wHTH) protein/Flp pilus assembly protein TadD
LPTSSAHPRIARFASFELNLGNGELRRDGVPLKLQPQPAKVLVVLVSRPGEVISREELADTVWGSETFVDFERGLNFAVRQIRATLGDDADQPRFLETLPKRGYRFVATVTDGLPGGSASETAAETKAAPVDEPVPEPRRASFTPTFLPAAGVGLGLLVLAAVGYFVWSFSRPPVPAHPIVLAVLPFDDLSADREEYLVDSLTEEMITQVTQINPEHLRVIARTSAMQYEGTKKSARQIGQELGADYILENSIRHQGGRLRITAQLVRTADQTHVWAENYDREVSDLLPLEREVTAGIAEQVHLKLLPTVASIQRVSEPSKERAVAPEAHDLYLQGRYYFNQRSREGLLKSVDYFEQAAAKDPNYAAAYASLADAYNLITFYGYDPSMKDVSQAKIAADKALQLDDSMAAAHAALGYTAFMWGGDWAGAEHEFKRAVELDDNYVPAHQWYALYLAANGRMGESLQQMREAQQLDPLSPSVHAGSGYVSYFARDYDQAIQQAQVALRLNPNFMVGHAVLGWAYTQQKKYPEAIGELQTAVKLSGGVLVYRCALARTYALSGNMTEARKMLVELEATAQSEPRGSGSALAALYLSVGDSEHALHWLEKTAVGDVQANWLRVDPAFDSLRGNPRFAAILSRIGSKTERAEL